MERTVCPLGMLVSGSRGRPIHTPTCWFGRTLPATVTRCSVVCCSVHGPPDVSRLVWVNSTRASATSSAAAPDSLPSKVRTCPLSASVTSFTKPSAPSAWIVRVDWSEPVQYRLTSLVSINRGTTACAGAASASMAVVVQNSSRAATSPRRRMQRAYDGATEGRDLNF